MTPFLILSIFLAYTLLLFLVTWITARKADNQSFFIGNKVSPWFVVAYGMIGASLSGVTFMSLPGWVKETQFSYMVVVFGYLFGYFVIATVLMPLYYKLKLTSIYSYLDQRFGFWSYKTGAGFFIISRTIGASLRMYLVISVLQIFVFDEWNVPFWINVLIFIVLIILYTLKGGIRTIIWTDTLQTTFMLLAVVLSVIYISKDLDISIPDLFTQVKNSSASKMFITDWTHERFFLKQFFSGMFITITMTGLDQEMMQKNLSCRNIGEAQKNMFTFSGILVFVNLLFLFLGALLLIYVQTRGVSVASSDEIFPTVAVRYLGPVAGLVFFIGLISAAFPSADGALTSLTTSVSIDFLGLNERKGISEKTKTRIRYVVHLSIALLFFIAVLIFGMLDDKAVIDKLFTIAGYTYGPLLGLYSFGLFTRRLVKDKLTPAIAILSPVICFILSSYSEVLFNGYKFGFELLLLNGLITFIGLYIFSRKPEQS
ncbi:MAG: sodium:solute symporter [Bacteroidetes bacterium GWE2_41_25]|nr:MAG: sodium:solute symporter [Bacteroidetes bacterium GWA2_40_15]OFX89736.1 MAG: sodium:solute symporter [Bacteroidetes bacterium GWC2_40_22]OFY00636.1 MAG: sodium:solute symporter [Bacteroidetes bacterium GWE2_41_25]OFY61337.1 MAG: sodium:solute symporter [Bacteroidetes bacterium GWF2_41_9]HAM09445.1 sodium:solute symporter [Bacteroidales bacterium]